MSKMIDPGTPEARRAWLDSLPVGTVLVDGSGARMERNGRCANPSDYAASGWHEDGEGISGYALFEWCEDSAYWPARIDFVPPPLLHTVAAAIAEWQAATFGPSSDMLATVSKMADEVAELRDELRQVPTEGWPAAMCADRIREEAADVAFMLIDLMRSFGGPDALAAAMAAKLNKNKSRSWSQGADGKWSGSK